MSTEREKPVPSYRKHKQSGQAIVTLTDRLGRRRDVLLGKYRSKDSRIEYARVIAEWEAHGRQLNVASVADLTLTELIARFWPWVEIHYRRPDGSPTREVADYKYSLRPINHLYGSLPAKDFGPLELKAVRQLMISGYTHPMYGPQESLCRGVINQRVGRICRMFRWAVENKLVPGSVLQELQAVQGLQCGRSEARETDPVQPIARAIVDATVPHMQPVVADMVLLQLETGMRPGELVIMRACDIDMSGAVWLYRPGQHKTAHRGHGRVVPIGPRAQEIIRRYLKLDTRAYLFSPAECVAAFQAVKRGSRKTKVQLSQMNRKKRKTKRRPGQRYSVDSYGKAIDRACDKAWPPTAHLRPRQGETKKAWQARLTEDERAELLAWQKAHRWHPHQLRHTRALELKREAGLDVARAVLGHRSPVITEHYATLDTAKAVEVMAKLG
jgi:integrase